VLAERKSLATRVDEAVMGESEVSANTLLLGQSGLSNRESIESEASSEVQVEAGVARCCCC
jgi:hypothetical protein